MFLGNFPIVGGECFRCSSNLWRRTTRLGASPEKIQTFSVTTLFFFSDPNPTSLFLFEPTTLLRTCGQEECKAVFYDFRNSTLLSNGRLWRGCYFVSWLMFNTGIAGNPTRTNFLLVDNIKFLAFFFVSSMRISYPFIFCLWLEILR